MKTIYLVTNNDKKVEVAKNALRKFDIDVEKISIDTPEIQAQTAEEVAKYSVKYAAELSKRPVFKGDVALHINDLGGFPGPFVKFINKWLKPEQFIGLFRNESEADFVDALAYCEPGKEPVCFVTHTLGKITTTPSGDNGNLVDSFFIPNGYDRTIASMSNDEYIKLWDNDRFPRLAEFISNKKS